MPRLGLPRLRLLVTLLCAAAVPVMAWDTSLFWALLVGLSAGSVAAMSAFACRLRPDGERTAALAALFVLLLMLVAYWVASGPRGPLRFPGVHTPLGGWTAEPAALRAWLDVTLGLAWTVGVLVWSACSPRERSGSWPVVAGATLGLYVTFAVAFGAGRDHAQDAFVAAGALGALAGAVPFALNRTLPAPLTASARTAGVWAAVTGAALGLLGWWLVPA